MKRLYKAINEGIKLIDFGNDKILKSEKIDITKSFNVGDAIFYNYRKGYNNQEIGELRALCVSIDPSIYISLTQLSNLSGKFGDKISIPNEYLINNSGYAATLYVLNNYNRTDLIPTIWSSLYLDEYIPSINEMEIIFNAAKNNLINKHLVYTDTDYHVISKYIEPYFCTCLKADKEYNTEMTFLPKSDGTNLLIKCVKID